MTGPVALVVTAAGLTRSRVSPALAGFVVAATLHAPMLTASGLLLLVAVHRFRMAARRSQEDRAMQIAALEAAELVSLGLAGGLSVAASHQLAQRHAPAPIASRLGGLVTAMERRGVTGALAADSGPMSGSSDALLGATSSGAPALPALDAYVRQEHHRRQTEIVERTRRLPIRLLVPLTLLVLPGFVLIAVGPTVVDSLARLSP